MNMRKIAVIGKKQHARCIKIEPSDSKNALRLRPQDIVYCLPPVCIAARDYRTDRFIEHIIAFFSGYMTFDTVDKDPVISG